MNLLLSSSPLPRLTNRIPEWLVAFAYVLNPTENVEKCCFAFVMQLVCKPATTMSSKAIPTLSGWQRVLGLLRTI